MPSAGISNWRRGRWVGATSLRSLVASWLETKDSLTTERLSEVVDMEAPSRYLEGNLCGASSNIFSVDKRPLKCVELG